MDFTYGTTNCNMEVEVKVIDPRLCRVNPRLQGRSKSDLKRGLQIRSALRVFTIEDYKRRRSADHRWKTTSPKCALRISTMGDHRVVVFEATSGQVGSDGVLKWTMNLDYKRLLMRLQRFVVRLQTDF